jgi:hypothetical protein
MQGIFVRVKPHDIPEAFHGKKAKILSIPQPYVAKVQIGSANL